MARGRGRGRGGGGSGGGKKAAAGWDRPKRVGLEQFVADPRDEFLGLNDDAGFEEEGSGNEWEQEKDVMLLSKHRDEASSRKKGKKGKRQDKGTEEAKEVEQEEEEEEFQGSSGWRGGDFYGGEDAGDDSEAGSEEELALQEAKRLEVLRARRLQGAGADDPLAALLIGGSRSSKISKREEEPASKAAGGGFASMAAQFESVFAAEAEESSVPRDLAQLSESQRKALLKKVAPELRPLLEDFKAKLASLRSLRPLLQPAALARLPASGASYLKSKASCLLSTLANLSYYILLRAEGGDVRAHPVVSQLVYLREISEQFQPLDEMLASKLKKAVKAAKEIPETLEKPRKEAHKEEGQEVGGSSKPAPAVQKPPTLADRLARLKLSLGMDKDDKGAGKAKATEPKPRHQMLSTADLLKLPSRRKKGSSAAEAPADLDEFDPTVGQRRLGTNLSDQLREVQQLLGERAAKAKPVSADTNVEPRERKARDRIREEPDELLRGRPIPAEDDEVELRIREKMERVKADQEKSNKKKAARQFHPEEAVEGRRATSKKILANRGLVRVRKKTAGNARVTNRQKYEKALKRRRGAVQELREGAPDGTYDGEATGVRTNLRKSLKLS